MQLGGIGLALSLFLPWYALVMPNVASEGFTIYEFDKTMFWGAVVVAILCIVQPKITSPDGMGVLFMLIGAAATGALVYKFWIDPPLGINGVELQGSMKAMAEGMMEAFGVESKPAYGGYIAVAGSAAVMVGGFIGFRSAGEAAQPYQYQQESWQSTHGDPYNARQPRSGQQYVAPQQQYAAGANVNQRHMAPDPFAPPTAQPDPFAVPPQPPQPPQQ